ELAPHRDALLCDPHALRSRHGLLDDIVPGALRLFPAEHDPGAAVFVIRLDYEAVAMRAEVLEKIDGVPVTLHRTIADYAGPGDVLLDHGSFRVAEEAAVTFVGQHREEGLLVRDLAAERVGDADGAPLVGVGERATFVRAGHDVVDE